MLQIDWLPNKKDTLPLYRQIYSYIKHEIRSGNWPISSKLPAQRSLAAISSSIAVPCRLRLMN